VRYDQAGHHFAVHTATYNLNKAELDRDRDGVACEKR